MMNAAAGIDTSALTSRDAIAAAKTAIAALEAAIAAATDVADTSMYQSQVDAAQTAVQTAEAALDLGDRQTAQRNAINSAVSMAQTAVAGVDNDSTNSEVASADAAVQAVKDAIADAADLAADDNAIAIANGALAVLEPQLAAAKTARQSAMDAAAKAKREAMAKTGKALRAALAGTTAGANDNALANIAAPTLATTGLTIDAAVGAGALPDTTNPASVELKAGAAAGSLGSWAGTDYALTTGTGDTKLTNEARVYINRGAGKSVAFADGLPSGVSIITTDGATKGYISVATDSEAALARIMAPAFNHSGTQTHSYSSPSDAFYTRGTYLGAPGQYRCTDDTACTTTNDGSGSPSALAGTWHFKPDSGAMISQSDANYLYFGWWVSKDKDGGPTAASAFAGMVGDVDGGDAGSQVNGGGLTGSATYAGKAAGKFAMSNPLDGTGNGGHFTADAMLTAKFGSIAADNDNGVTGTINNFRLNDGSEDPGWSVTLNRSSGWSDNGGITGPTSNATVWSINGNKATASGAWSGTMYDELPGNAPAGDGSTVPTTVTGTFYSEFSTIGRMVGAFGASKQ